MCGEILSLRAATRAPAPPTTAGDELRRMLSDGLIRYHKHSDGKRTFRICDPAGYKALEEIDARLLEHAEALTGKHGARYPGSKTYRLKKRREAALLEMLLDAGIVVDGFRTADDGMIEITPASPALTDPESIIRTMDKDAPLFISGALLRRRDNDIAHTRRETTISAGSLISPGGIYSTFVISTPRFRWYAASETAAANDITRLYEKALSLKRNADGRFRAILYTETTDVAEELMRMTIAGNYKTDPTKIFRLSYIAPLEDPELAVNITKLLTIPDWRARSNKVLGITKSGPGPSDGETKDGKRIYNLLCCNVARVNEIEREVRRKQCRLIIHSWQKPVLERLYETELDATILEPKHFTGLLLAVNRSQGK